MTGIRVNATIHQEVYIDPSEAFKKIKQALGLGTDHSEHLCIKDDQLMRGVDVSYHGSPLYEYEMISNNPKWIELYNSICCLDDYFQHYTDPAWDRVLEQTSDEIMNMSL